MMAAACSSSSAGGGSAADGAAPPSETGSPLGDGGGAEDAGDNGTTPDASTPMSDGGPAETSSGEDGGLPPIDTKSFMRLLTNAQLGQLCDWSTGQLGGYDATVHCQNVTRTPTTQTQCIASISFDDNCVLTVGQFEGCVMAEAPSQGCDRPGPDCMMEQMCRTRGDAGM
jgi:hypothetical protein